MSRLKEASEILDAAEVWRERCLLGGQSLFGEETIWTTKYFNELETYFVKNLEKGGGTFIDKLKVQLEPASPQTKRLCAEIEWIYLLISTAVSHVSKLDRIRTIWSWSEEDLPEDLPVLGAVLEKGMVHTGTAFNVFKHLEYVFIISMMQDWCIRSVAERESLLADPWKFAAWLDGQADANKRQFRHILLFLLFPDKFEPIASKPHKVKIVESLRDDSNVPVIAKKLDLLDLDREILKIRDRLLVEFGLEEVNFYYSPVSEHWKNGDTPPEIDLEKWYQNKFGSFNVWVISTGSGARMWQDFLDSKMVAIGWDELGDLSEYGTKKAIHDTLIENGSARKPVDDSLVAWKFVHEVEVGDTLIAKKRGNDILGWGVVEGEYVYDPERAEFQNTRAVNWSRCEPPVHLEEQFTVKTLAKFSDNKQWLHDLFKLIDRGKPVNEIEGSYSIEEALKDLFLDEADFRSVINSIALRKNLILQGPPGVGKTFIARKIAWCLIGRKDSKPMEMVQFHQSYAYEDFVQGWRPTETGGFTLRDGVFYKFCKRAEVQPDTPFIFIIDEINRGNLSRIFGELLMLIEADKRGPDYAIPPIYSEEPFSVPENVHILGLMNTADRSLAIVDYALRRRFAFHTLQPAFGRSKFREYLLELDVEKELVDRINQKLSALNETIIEDKDLGTGFQIGHSFFVPTESADFAWYEGIVRSQIEPLLNEYWFDHPEKINGLVEGLLE